MWGGKRGGGVMGEARVGRERGGVAGVMGGRKRGGGVTGRKMYER